MQRRPAGVCNAGGLVTSPTVAREIARQRMLCATHVDMRRSELVVKVFIERRVQSGNERRVLALLKELRIQCLDRQGYVSGESLADTQDQHTLLVVSTWWNKGAWEAWHDSAIRREIESRVEPLLLEPEKVRVFMDGIPPEAAGP